MLRRHRRFLFPLAALLLTLPLLATLATPRGVAMSAEERRLLAPIPRLDDWSDVPRATDAYLRDHFGLRPLLLHGYAVLVHLVLRTGNADVWVGRAGRLFYRGDDMLQQSAGLELHPAAIAATAAILVRMRDALAARGAHLLVAPPPNAATIEPDDLPAWARNHGRPTDYDLLLAALAERGVAAVDLRPALREAGRAGKVYFRNDSHWTLRGVLAGFDAIAVAAGRRDWQQAPAAALGSPQPLLGGDLARLLGIAQDVSEKVEPFKHWAAPPHWLGADGVGPYELDTGGAGPRVLVIGDSFTDWALASLLVDRAERFFWMHHRRCTFDWTWVERLHPDAVWYMPTERWLACPAGNQPAGLPP